MTASMYAEDMARGLYRKAGAVLERRRRGQLRLPKSTGATSPATVQFIVPDYNRPAGGVRVIYRHVDILNAAGIPAVVVHQQKGFRCTWFDHQTPVTDSGSARLGRDDIVVVPELDVDLMDRMPPGVRYVIFNQNTHLTWRRAPGEVDASYSDDAGLVGIVAVSAHNEEVLRYGFPDIDVHRIHISLDPAMFSPGEDVPPRVISYMPRRGRGDDTQVLELLRRRGVLDGWTVRPLDGLTHAEVAEALRCSRIFLSFTYQEGFGLPAAEAMACGNYVIGYHGFAGREFFRPEFSAPIETGDVLAFSRAIEEAVLQDRSGPDWCRSRGLEASRFVLSEYAPDREVKEVVALYSDLLDRSARPAAQ